MLSINIHFLNLNTTAETNLVRKSFQVHDDQYSTATASFEDRRHPRKQNTIDPLFHGGQLPFTSGNSQEWDFTSLKAARSSMHYSVHQGQALNKTQLDALERRQAQELGINIESSISGLESSSLSLRSEIPAKKTPPLELDNLKKPLPQIPISANERAKKTTLDRYLNSRQHGYPDPNTGTPIKQAIGYDMSFSFQPGDDEDLIPRRSTDLDRAQRKAVIHHLAYGSSRPDPNTSKPKVSATSVEETSCRLTSTNIQAPKSVVPAKASQLPRLQDNDHVLGRMDSSSSSVVAAVRNNSGRSSVSNSQAGQAKLRRNADTTTSGGSSDAVSAATAAARAYAASHRKQSSEGARKGSGSG